MESLPITRPRAPTNPMGYLNYPPEIMNIIYHELLVDHRQILAFLCSPHPFYCFIGLKRVADPNETPDYQQLEWQQLYDARHYIDGSGLSARFLRVCKKIWSEGTPILYGNLTIAMRWTPKQPDPCLYRYFTRNTTYVLAWAKFVFPRYDRPFYTPGVINKQGFTERLMHWAITHQRRESDVRLETLRQMQDDRFEKKACRRVKSKTA